MLVLTGLPQIFSREVLGRSTDPKWFQKLAFAFPLGALALGWMWAPARALTGFSVVLLIQATGYVLAQVFVNRRLMHKWAPRARALQGLSGAGAFKVIPVLLLLPALLLTGSADRLFLSAGDLGRPLRLPGGQPGISWTGMFGVAVVGTVGFLLVYARFVKPAGKVDLRNLLRFAPIILLAAVVNAFTEEFLYRNAMLGFLIPAVGQGQAVCLTSIRFGVVHFYGTPSGIVGVLAATLFGLVLGLSMVQTGGSAFAWALHVIADLVIFGAAAAMWRPREQQKEAEQSGERNLDQVELG